MALRGTRPSGFRQYIDYYKIRENNKPFPGSYNWQLKFITIPRYIYFPPYEIFCIRCKSFTPPEYSPPEVSSVELHGYTLKKYGLAQWAGECSGTWQDRLDYSIWTAFRELLYEVDRPFDRTSRPIQECYWDAELYQLSDQDVPVRKWVILDALLTGISDSKTFDGTKSPIGEGQFSLSYQMAYEVHLHTGDLL